MKITSYENDFLNAADKGTFRDITERRRNEEMCHENERLHIINKTKSEFLTVMSHELRTPLNAIIGFSELLSKADEKEFNEKHRRFAKKIHSSGNHLLEIIDDVLDLSKAESGKMEIIIENVSIPNVISESVELIEEIAAKRNIKFNKKTGSDVEYIETGLGRKYAGTGLRLAVSKKIVELLGGRMTFESRYGKGSTFTFTLPIEEKRREAS